MRLEPWLDKWIQNRFKGLPLRVELWNGRTVDLCPAPRVTMVVQEPSALRYLLRPSFASIGEAFVDGKIDVQGPTREMISLLESYSLSQGPLSAARKRWRARFRSKKADTQAIQHHYDVSNDFYALWLDRNLVYSCAYFNRGDEDLHAAQEQKLDYICRKLMLKEGERFLDIGCGWGGLMRWAARNYGVRATGVTLSRNQAQLARELIREEGLQDRCKVLLLDYRDLSEERPFDKIASIGMFEHVGLANMAKYFGKAWQLLREGGLMLNHGICSSSVDQSYVAGDGGEFMDRYVFPYEELPHVSFALRAMAGQNFEISDVESLRPHYERTLTHWLERLESNEHEARRLAGARRYRIWRAYLAGSAHAFGRGWLSVYQVLAAKNPASGAWQLSRTRAHLYQAQ